MSFEPISASGFRRSSTQWVLDRSVASVEAEIRLSEEQAEIVGHRNGAKLVLAGPGTGKTFTLTQAIVQRMQGEQALTPDQILALTFARKAANELRERVILNSSQSVPPAVSTFHSLALALVREFDGEHDASLALMSGPEQELAVREILSGIFDEPLTRNKINWPQSLAAALKTRGLSVEVRNAMARAQSLGLTAHRLGELAKQAHQSEWEAISRVLEEYLDVIAQQRSLDYNELISHAVSLTSQPGVQAVLHQRYRAVFVDEYQDTDPLQVELLRNIIGPQATLIAVGDPDQSIYGFRGATDQSISQFAQDFGYLGEISTTALRHTHRYGSEIRDASFRVISRNSIAALPLAERAEHRSLSVDSRRASKVQVVVCDSAESEAEEIAEKIYELAVAGQKTSQAVRWADFAILVRSGSRSIPVIERALVAAGIPVQVTFDEVPLSQEPAVAHLLHFLEVARNPEIVLNTQAGTVLVQSPLSGLDSGDYRRLAKLLRQHNQDPTLSSDYLVSRALMSPRDTLEVPGDVLGETWNAFVALRDTLLDCHQLIQKNAPIEDVLWKVWSTGRWSHQLRQAALHGDARAHHDLDSVMALFELARSRNQKSVQLGSFLHHVRGLLVAADRIDVGHAADAVNIMTAHRSKGLEWDYVFVAGADEGVWPDVAARSSLFQPERLRVDGLGSIPDRHEVIAEERRLFYVACTRAKQYLWVSSTGGNPDSGVIPSRFLSQVVVDFNIDLHRVKRSASMVETQARFSPTQLVSQLRRTATNPHVSDSMREAAEARLAYLASLTNAEGELLFPAAHPQAWWGVVDVSENDKAIFAEDQAIYVRGSSLQTFQDCSLSWFMSQRAQAGEVKSIALSFGSIVHAFAHAVAQGEIEPTMAAIEERLDGIFERLSLEAPWVNQQQRQDALVCLQSFLKWHHGRTHRLVGTEVDFEGTWEVESQAGYRDTVRLRGTIDVVEVHDGNVLYVADIKTSTTSPSKEKTEANLQLGLYQAAIDQGLLDDFAQAHGVTVGEGCTAGGAALVLVRNVTAAGLPTLRTQAPLLDGQDNWMEEVMATTAQRARAEHFVATISDACVFCPVKSSCPLQPEGSTVIS